MRALLTGIILLGLVGCKSTSNLEVISGFDGDRYMGVWYEVARYPHRFEKGMSSVSATYSLNKDGTIKVMNRGYTDDEQKWDDIEGVAKLKGAEDKGWLKVSFFKPFYASYKIIYLNDEYTKAIVTGPTYGYLWILVRDPALPEAELEDLISKAENLSFEREELIIVDQSRNAP